MKTFRQFFEQKESKSLTTAFGRFNPPTIGHEKLINAVEAAAGGGDFVSLVCDGKHWYVTQSGALTAGAWNVETATRS